MSESKIEIGKKTVDPNVFKKSDGDFSNAFKAERRAYAILRATGNGVCGAGTAKVESPEVSTSNYESIITGTRKVPKPSLTSVDWSSDGANDVIDAYLWKATVSFTCYSPEDFGQLDTGFFRHLNEVELTLGWINSGNPVTVYGNIVDYQFSINEKLHYDCSVTFAGAHIQSSAAFNTAAKQPGSVLLKFGESKQNPTGYTIQAQSIVGILRAQAEQTFGVDIPADNEADQTNQNTQQSNSTSDKGATKVTQTNTKTTSEGGGFARGNNHFSKVRISIPDSSWWTYFWGVDDVQSVDYFYVSFQKLIDTVNQNITNVQDNFEGFFYFIPPDSVTKLTHNLCKSANPVALINGWSAQYSTTLNLFPGATDFYINFSELERIEEEIRRDKSDTPHLTKKSVLQFFKKVCALINENLGNAVQMEVIPYNQFVTDDKKKKYGYEITDRKTVIKPVKSHTKANPLDLGSLIRSISVQSTTDSEMAAIALSAAQGGGEGSSTIIRGGLFGCFDKKSSEPPPGWSVLKSAQSQADASYGAKPGEIRGQGTAVAGVPKYLQAVSARESTSNPAGFAAVTTTALKIDPVKTVENEKTPEEQLKGMYAAYSVFDSAVVSDTLVVMKKIWGGKPGTINGYSYGVTVTVTVDGYAENLFGQTFRVAGLPQMLMRDNVYFVVLKQGHKYSNGDWTMDLEGQMMFDFAGPISKNPPIEEGIIVSTNNSNQGGGGVGGANVNLNQYSLIGGYIEIAKEIIKKEEGGIYLPGTGGPKPINGGVPKWDATAVRAGFGTDKIFRNGVLTDVTYDTRFTFQEAVATLNYQLPKQFEEPMISWKNKKGEEMGLGRANWNKLNDNQKAALLILVYNTGPYIFPGNNNWARKIYDAITRNDYAAAADGIQNGPITEAGTGKVMDGLIRRRALEAELFRKGLNSTQYQGNSSTLPQNIVIGDSQTVFVARGTQTFKIINGNSNMTGAEEFLWLGSQNLAWLNTAVLNFNKSGKWTNTAEVKNVAICIGTNGGFSESEATIGVLIDNIKKKFRTAKLFAIKGSWDWGSNTAAKGINGAKANKYYARFEKFGVEVISPAIGSINNPHGDFSIYKTIGNELEKLKKT